MKQYKDLVKHILTNGTKQPNRTGVDTLKCNGYMMKFNMADGFPLLTLKHTPFKMIIGEMLAFLRGANNVKEFNALGVKVWDANAKAEYWINNPYYKGDGDLGRIYGVQARCWKKPICSGNLCKTTLGMSLDELEGTDFYYSRVDDIVYQLVDQLEQVINNLIKGIDDRRGIITHWNPSEIDQMSLPPCHLLYQFGITDDKLNLSMYQRSCDVGLGIPFNIAGYSWLLHMIAHITNLKAGTFTHFLHDVHIYENHIEGLEELLTRKNKSLPKLIIPTHIDTLSDLETWVTPDHFGLKGYNSHEAIKLNMAV